MYVYKCIKYKYYIYIKYMLYICVCPYITLLLISNFCQDLSFF